MKQFVFIMLFLVLTITGCTSSSSPQVPVPEMSKIMLVQYEIVMPGSQNPVALDPSNPNEKVIIQKNLGWMSQATAVGYDDKYLLNHIHLIF